MKMLQNAAISPPQNEFLVTFRVAEDDHGPGIRRTIRVAALMPAHAKRICQQRYPKGGHWQVFEPERAPMQHAGAGHSPSDLAHSRVSQRHPSQIVTGPMNPISTVFQPHGTPTLT